MTVEEFTDALKKLPSDMEIVCGAEGFEDQFFRAKPFEAVPVSVAGVGVVLAIVVGVDYSRPTTRRPSIFRNIVGRDGIGGSKKGRNWRRRSTFVETADVDEDDDT